MIETWAASVAMLFLSPAPSYVPPYPLVERRAPIILRADLDGDGRPDSVKIEFLTMLRSNEYFRVTIGRDTLLQFGESLNDTASIVDIDRSDRFREIAIPEAGPSDDEAVYFVRLTPAGLRLIGKLPGTLNDDLFIDGSGVIHTTCRGRILETWYYPCSFCMYKETGALGKVPQAFMPMNTTVHLKRDLPLFVSPQDRRISGHLLPEEEALIDLTDDDQWVHIRGRSGAQGWFWVRNWRIMVRFEDVPVEDVFDGLDTAD